MLWLGLYLVIGLASAAWIDIHDEDNDPLTTADKINMTLFWPFVWAYVFFHKD